MPKSRNGKILPIWRENQLEIENEKTETGETGEAGEIMVSG